MGIFSAIRRACTDPTGEDSYVALFIGPDDDETCDGCRKAMDGNPHALKGAPNDLTGVPKPGDSCGSNCRHMLQVMTAEEYAEGVKAARYERFLRTGDPSDVAMYLHEHGKDLDEVWATIDGDRIADRVARVRLEMQGMGIILGDGPDDTSLLGFLSISALDSAAAYLRDQGTVEGRALGAAGFGPGQQKSAYALAEALNRFDPASNWRYAHNNQTKWSYVLDGKARRAAAKAKREASPKGVKASRPKEVAAIASRQAKKKARVNADPKASSAAVRRPRASAKTTLTKAMKDKLVEDALNRHLEPGEKRLSIGDV
jgi:hypothetical protein